MGYFQAHPISTVGITHLKHHYVGAVSYTMFCLKHRKYFLMSLSLFSLSPFLCQLPIRHLSIYLHPLHHNIMGKHSIFYIFPLLYYHLCANILPQTPRLLTHFLHVICTLSMFMECLYLVGTDTIHLNLTEAL